MYKDLSRCPECNYSSIKWSRWLELTDRGYWNYYYQIKCSHCKKLSRIAPHPYPSKITENYRWHLSDESKRTIISRFEKNTLPKFTLPLDIDILKIINKLIQPSYQTGRSSQLRQRKADNKPSEEAGTQNSTIR